MSEVRLLVREAERDWSGTIHANCADRAVAALSADPITLEELEAATARFARPRSHARFFANLSPGVCDEPYDTGLVVIDLSARLVVVDSTYSSPDRTGYVEYHDGQCCTQFSLRYHLAEDWQFLRNSNQWRSVANERRRNLVALPSIDPRAVFYGRPLLEFIARECLAKFAKREEIVATVRLQWVEEARLRLAKELDVSPEQVDAGLLTDEEITPKTWPGDEQYASPFYDTLSQIHAAWLLNPRDDLNGACPREVALERHGHIGWDLQDRCDQWSTLGRCAPGLAESSHAFQHGGFGTHELVKYYDLVRELLWSCWQQLNDLANSGQPGRRADALTTGDILSTEVPRLETVRDTWFDTPDPECHGRTPRSIITRERARIPESISGHEAMVDPDCPCCQMMADMPGPMFWHLDGCNNDDDFAFDTSHQTREEWEQERREWDERSRKFNAEWDERKRLGVTDSRDEASVWSRSISLRDAEVPVGIRVFSLGCHLAELIVELRAGSQREATLPEAQRHIDQLNRDFGNLREVLQGPDSSLAAALIMPVAQCFIDDLGVVAMARPNLTLKCESLANDLHQLLDPPSEEKPAWDCDNFEDPF
ncbi:MAG: hypothetical protein JWN70_6474 [Planctomycetaceae bacterium]|nr:hypothetical protein [Planctomycetaceae bacterium]